MKTFQTGQILTTRSTCDYDCVYTAVVKGRTAKMLTIEIDGETKRVKIHSDGNSGEYIYPFGMYSMCPVMTADKATMPPTEDRG